MLLTGIEPASQWHMILSHACLPISPQERIGTGDGTWTHTPHPETRFKRVVSAISPHQHFEHLGGNRTLNDFQILQRSAFLCNIIRFVYSDTTWHLPTMHRDKCCTETRWFWTIRMGIEPTTSCVTGKHSDQLNYRTIYRCPLQRHL